MADRDLPLRPAPNERDPVPLTQKERLEILRRLERADQLEEEVRQIRQKLKERDRELERLRRSATALDAATPPSKKLHRPAAPAEPRAKGRWPGGQPGHPPHTRPRPDHVNKTVDLTLDQCPDCPGTVGDPADAHERFVTELIPAYLWVLKILVHRYWYSHCHRFVQAETDRALPGRQFGPRLASTLVRLSMMGLPVRRIQETVAAMAGLEVSVGAIQGLLEASPESLGPDYEVIDWEVLRAHLVQPDEKSIRVDRENW